MRPRASWAEALVAAVLLLGGFGAPAAEPAAGTDAPGAACVDRAAATVHCGSTPSAAFDRAGQLWVAFAHGGHVHVAASADAGLSFNAARAVNALPEALDVNGENRPKIAFGAGQELYVTWTRKMPGGYNGDIRFSRSLDRAKTFDPPITLNDDGLVTGHRFESLLVDGTGDVYVAWVDKRDAARSLAQDPSAAIYYTVSTDRGARFTPNRRVAAGSCECCRIAMADGPAVASHLPAASAAAERGKGAAIFWRHVFDGSTRDHAFALLDRNGIALAAERATHDGWRIDACPHHGPAMISAGAGRYHVAWFTAGAARRGVFYARYEPRSAALEQELSVSSAPSAAHPSLAAVPGRLVLAWKEFDGDNTVVRVIDSGDEGASWSAPRTAAHTPGKSDHPMLLTRGAEVFLSWHTETEGLRVLPLESSYAGAQRP